MSRQGGIKGWERKEDYNGEKVYYQRYRANDEAIDPRTRVEDRVSGVMIRGNEEEGFVVLMERDGERGHPSREFSSIEDAEEEAKRNLKDINETRLFETNTTVDEVMKIIEDIASDKGNDQYRMYRNIDAPSEIEKLAKFAGKIKKRSNSRF